MRGSWLIPALCAALSGCASAVNLTERGQCNVYGGTRVDAALVADGFSSNSNAAKAKEMERPVLFWSGCCGLVDLPLSVVADTVTLPITVLASAGKSEDAKPADKDADRETAKTKDRE